MNTAEAVVNFVLAVASVVGLVTAVLLLAVCAVDEWTDRVGPRTFLQVYTPWKW
jgi:hypothetical protein